MRVGSARESTNRTQELAALVEHALFDQLVRLEEQCLRDREFECLRGLEVDHQLELCGLLHREISGLGTLEDFVDIDGSAPNHIDEIRPIRHQSASVDIFLAM